MTGFIVSVFPSRNRVSSQEAFEGLELGEGKPSRPVLRGPGGRKATWLLGNYAVIDYMTMSAPTTRVDLVDVKPNQGSGRKEPNMLIIGCDYHPSMQQIAFVDTETGERGERRLMHRDAYPVASMPTRTSTLLCLSSR